MHIAINDANCLSPRLLDDGTDTARRAQGLLDHVDADSGEHRRTVVYQYRFDGYDSEYLVRGQDGRLEWLAHQEGMSYNAYAYLMMDSIVLTARGWNGTVHESPDTRSAQLEWRDSDAAAAGCRLEVLDTSVTDDDTRWLLVGLAEQPATTPARALAAAGAAAVAAAEATCRALGWIPAISGPVPVR